MSELHDDVFWLDEVEENPMALELAINEWWESASNIRKGKDPLPGFRILTQRLVMWCVNAGCAIDSKPLSRFESNYRHGKKASMQDVGETVEAMHSVVRVKVTRLIQDIIAPTGSGSEPFVSITKKELAKNVLKKSERTTRKWIDQHAEDVIEDTLNAKEIQVRKSLLDELRQ